MSTTPLSRRELDERSAQLSRLLAQWDPLGVMGDPDWPRDEYDCLVGPLLTLLARGAEADRVAEHLREQATDHFGLPGEGPAVTRAAVRIVAWFDRGWRTLATPIPIFIPGPDGRGEALHAALARPLGADRYRIVGAEGAAPEGRWRFPPGAIVRCARGEPGMVGSGLVAVARIDDDDGQAPPSRSEGPQ